MMFKLEKIIKTFIFALGIVAAILVVSPMNVHAGSWHDVYLKPGETYDVSSAKWNTTVYINKPGNYNLKGESTKCKVVIESGGVNVYLHDGLKIDPNERANIGASTPSLIIEDMDGTVTLISKKGADIYFGGYLWAAAIEKEGYNSKLVFETEDPSNPGTITAYRSHGFSSAGIGSTYRLTTPVTTGNMEFNSGNIVATGGMTSAGIGGGDSGSAYKITINGGNVRAVGGENGTGIGGGYHGNAQNITVNGGTVYAKGEQGAGIGSGEQSKYAKNITINGGNVTAISDLGAGIGGGQRSEVENLRINGGSIYAYSRKTAIGSSCDQHLGILKNMYITGGNIVAESKGTAIGAADSSPGPNNIYISGGIIEAKADNYAIGGGGFSSVLDEDRITNVTISGGTIHADGGKKDIGTNNGWMDEFNITITGGSLLAESQQFHSPPKNQFGAVVHRTNVTLEGLGNSPGFAVENTDISGLPSEYGLHDVYTRNGMLHFWLPDYSEVNTATLPGNTVYRGIVKSGWNGTLYKDTLVVLEANDGSLRDGGGTVYQGSEKIIISKKPEVSPGYSITGYKVSGTDVMIADKDGKFSANISVNGNEYTDANGKWMRESSSTVTFQTVVEAKEYAVKFDANVPVNTRSVLQGSIDDITVKYDQDFELPSSGYTLRGYSFAGWNTKADGRGTAYSLGEQVSKIVAESEIILYAQWEPLTYSVKFDANGGSGSMENQTMTYDKYENLKPNEFSAPEDKMFIGWKRTNALGGRIYPDQASVMNLCDYEEDGIPIGYILEAQWVDKDQVSIVIILDGETYSGLKDVALVLESSDDEEYKVPLVESGGAYTPVEPRKQIQPGQYKLYIGTEPVASVNMDEGSQYIVIEFYSVEVSCDDKLTDATVSPNVVPVGSSVWISVKDDLDNGYVFDKWVSIVGVPKYFESSAYDIEADISIRGKTELRAISRPVEYTVSFDANKPAITESTISGEMDSQDFIYDKQAVLKKNSFALKGYEFTEWNTEKDGSGTSYEDSQSVLNLTKTDKKNITLYAQWKADEYRIVFNGNTADSGVIESIDCIYDREYTLPECEIEKADYHFLGWCDAIDGIGTYYNPGDKVKNMASKNGETVVLYAIWEHDFYTVKFDGGESESQVPDMQVWTEEELTLSNPGFRKTGYELTGWNTASDGTGKSYEVGEKVANLADKNEEVTLYAQWKAIEEENVPIVPGDSAVPSDPTGSNNLTDNPDTGDGYAVLMCIAFMAAAIGTMMAVKRKKER